MRRVPVVDGLMWLALTVRMEAENQSFEGKLAVAWAIMNRAKRKGRSLEDTIMQAWHFSAWNTDSPTRMRLDELTPGDPNWYDCYKASAGAFFGLTPDPSKGADHYLNPKVAQPLPSWWDKHLVTAIIGDHTFARLL